jgi:hypothetical protein
MPRRIRQTWLDLPSRALPAAPDVASVRDDVDTMLCHSFSCHRLEDAGALCLLVFVVVVLTRWQSMGFVLPLDFLLDPLAVLPVEPWLLVTVPHRSSLGCCLVLHFSARSGFFVERIQSSNGSNRVGG